MKKPIQFPLASSLMVAPVVFDTDDAVYFVEGVEEAKREQSARTSDGN